jgi:hypothetical protein
LGFGRGPCTLRPAKRTYLFALAGLAASACSLDRVILDGTLKSTRDAASAFDTLSDLEVAQSGAAASLVQLEGMQKLAPDNEDALFLLLQSWTGYGGAFIEDAWEQAYDRALLFGSRLLEQKRPGFAAAQRNFDSMKAYLSGFSRADAEALLWTGLAWLSRGGVAAERPEVVADLFVGVALLERSVELDPGLAYQTGRAALGAYHARAHEADDGRGRRRRGEVRARVEPG